MLNLVLRTAVLSLVLVYSTSSWAQPTDEEVGELSSFLVLFPQLRTLPRPDSVTEGLRVTYAAAGATTETGGGGLVQYDVVATDGANVFSHLHTYGDGGQGLIPFGQGISRGLPALGQFWLNPTVLANAESVASSTLSVSRIQKPVAGEQREVVRFQTETPGGRTVYEFSAASGLLTFSSIGSPSGAAQLTLTSTRGLNLPWESNAAQNWARPQARLEYSGAKTTQINESTVRQAMSVTVMIAEATNRWSILDSITTLEGLGQSTNRTVSGAGQLVGAFWLPQGALEANLSQDPVMVDQDPETGAQTFVRRGDGVIVVQQELAAAITTWTYSDALGVLEQQRSQTLSLNSTEETVLGREGGSNLDVLNQEPPLSPGPESPDSSNPNPSGEMQDPAPRNSKGPSDSCTSVRGTASSLALMLAIMGWFRLGRRGHLSTERDRHRFTDRARG